MHKEEQEQNIPVTGGDFTNHDHSILVPLSWGLPDL
jgi:hypothetical protein